MESKDGFIKALVKMQSELKPVSKDALNPYFKSKYVSLYNLTEAVYPVLHANGFFVTQKINGETLETVLMHAMGEISSVCPLPLKDQAPQTLGSAISYMRRYSLMALLGVVADDDDDGHTASKPIPKPVSNAVKSPLVTKPTVAKDEGGLSAPKFFATGVFSIGMKSGWSTDAVIWASKSLTNMGPEQLGSAEYKKVCDFLEKNPFTNEWKKKFQNSSKELT